MKAQRLVRLWRYRKQVEEVLRVELAQLDGVAQQLANDLHQLEASYAVAVSKLLAEVEAGVGACELAGLSQVVQSQAAACEWTERLLKEADRRRSEKLRQVLEASRERKTVELLVQREQRKQRLLEQKREQQAHDEAGHRLRASAHKPASD
jgi:flagellar export protein FliJ